GPPQRVLGFLLDTDLYGLDLAGVREVARPTPLTYVPGAPRAILGVISLRGQMLPIVDLRLILGMESAGVVTAPLGEGVSSGRSRARIVVVAQGEIVAGLLVDAVTEVYEAHAPVEPPQGARAGSSLIEGQMRL